MNAEDFDPRPIGVFDSGIGGLTVLNQLEAHLPQESFIYLGDTARLPYGSKSPETIKKYVQQNLDFFIKNGKNIKALVIACNSASSVLNEVNLPRDLPAFGVIEPGARAALESSINKKIGLWATRATVNGRAYEQTLRSLSQNQNFECFSCACPLLVPLVEEGLWNHSLSHQAFDLYLPDILKHDVDTLILGCTHYPLLKPALVEHLKSLGSSHLNIIDSAIALSQDVQKAIKEKRIKASSHRKQSTSIFLSDAAEHFKQIAQQAFPQWKLTDFEWVNI